MLYVNLDCKVQSQDLEDLFIQGAHDLYSGRYAHTLHEVVELLRIRHKLYLTFIYDLGTCRKDDQSLLFLVQKVLQVFEYIELQQDFFQQKKL
jgi:hypothetical protein